MRAVSAAMTKRAAVIAVVVAAVMMSGRVAQANTETLRVYRLYSPSYGPHDHMESHNQYEAQQLGFYPEAAYLFYAHPYGAGGTPGPAHPVHRCLIWGWEHMTSLAANCEGAGYVEAQLGYALDNWAPGHTGLYRCRNAQARDEHFVSTDPGCEGRVPEGLLGYIRLDDSFQQAELQGAPDNECLGRCGLGCSWMPWEAWTSECRAHDECVRDNGQLACLGSFVDAAVSYVWAGVKTLVKTVTSFIKGIFSFW